MAVLTSTHNIYVLRKIEGLSLPVTISGLHMLGLWGSEIHCRVRMMSKQTESQFDILLFYLAVYANMP